MARRKGGGNVVMQKANRTHEREISVRFHDTLADKKKCIRERETRLRHMMYVEPHWTFLNTACSCRQGGETSRKIGFSQ
jgi:hypothetical protein